VTLEHYECYYWDVKAKTTNPHEPASGATVATSVNDAPRLGAAARFVIGTADAPSARRATSAANEVFMSRIRVCEKRAKKEERHKGRCFENAKKKEEASDRRKRRSEEGAAGSSGRSVASAVGHHAFVACSGV
jgi:hypothetical protein